MNDLLLVTTLIFSFLMACLWADFIYDMFKMWRGKD
jgi:hypothetical protein